MLNFFIHLTWGKSYLPWCESKLQSTQNDTDISQFHEWLETTQSRRFGQL